VSDRIPNDHPAAKSLEHAFRSLGAEQARAQRRTRTGRVGRIAVATLAPVLAVAAVATGTKVFTGDGDAVRSDRGGTPDPKGESRLSPSTRPLALATARNPGGGAPWGMRAYRGTTGRTCLAVGQVVRGRLGLVESGRFKEFPTDLPQTCGRMRAAHFLFARQETADGDNVLFGAVDRTVQHLHLLRNSAGRRWEVEIADDGTFIVARSGRQAFSHQVLVADGTRGRTALPVDPT
jgi:hypothetical protein